jgi:hypothetical protein
VWRDLLLGQGRFDASGGRGVFGQPSFQGVAAHDGSVPAGEQRIGLLAAAFGQPGFDDRGGGGGQRGDPLFAALAQTVHVRSDAEADVRAG